MGERTLLGFIKAQHGAPGPRSAVSYDIEVNDGDRKVLYRGVIPATPRPPEEIDVGVIEPGRAVEVRDVEGVLHFMFTEYPHTAECEAPAPLIDLLLSAVAGATPAQRAILRSALGVTPA